VNNEPHPHILFLQGLPKTFSLIIFSFSLLFINQLSAGSLLRASLRLPADDQLVEKEREKIIL